MAKRNTVEVAADGELHMRLDPEAQRVAELADDAEFERLDEVESGELFRVTEEIMATESARLIFMRTWPAEPGKKGYVGELSPAEFTMERVARLFGPGKYRVRVAGPRGFLKGGGNFEIAARAEPEAQNNDVRSMLEEMDKRNREREAEKKGRIMEYVTALGPIIAPLLAAMISRRSDTPNIAELIAALKPAPAPSMSDLVQTMQGLKDLSGGAPQADPLDKALALLEVIQDRSGTSAGETGTMDLLKEAIKHIGPGVGGALETLVSKAAASRADAAPPAEVRRLPSTPTDPIIVKPPANVADGEGANMGLLKMMGWLKGELEMLLQKAQRNADPALWADALLDDAEGNGIDPNEVIQLIAREDWFLYLQKFDARVTNFQPWFTELRTELLRLMGAGAAQTQIPGNERVVVRGPESAEVVDRPAAPPSLGVE